MNASSFRIGMITDTNGSAWPASFTGVSPCGACRGPRLRSGRRPAPFDAGWHRGTPGSSAAASTRSSSSLTDARPSTRRSARSTSASASAIRSGFSSRQSRQPSRPPTRAGVSPTATDTTGRLQASASFTTLGDPSYIETKISASQAFMYSGTRSCGTPQATTSSAFRLGSSRDTTSCARP